MTVFVCGPDETGFDECWNCTGPLYGVKKAMGEPYADDNGRGRYCSLDCRDEASERNERLLTRCTTCGRGEGHCDPTGDPEGDPHPFWRWDGPPPPELDAWLERNRHLWELA